MKRVVLVGLWFQTAILTLSFSLFFLIRFSQINNLGPLTQNSLRQNLLDNEYQMYAALPSVLGSFSSNLAESDARPEIIKRYLQKYDSPLLPYSTDIVQLSDQNGLDFRLIVAIAQCESNVCKRIPDGSFNCWGFGNGEARFESWDQALSRVARTLKVGYIDQGLITPEQIMPKYAPPSVAKGGPWAKCVSQFLGEME